MKAARFTVAILIALLLCMAYGGNAQTKNDKPSTVEVVKQIIPDSAKLTLKTVYNDAKEALSSLGAALKVGSEHVYEVLVRQQVVTAITYLIADILAIIVTWALFVIAYKMKGDDSYWDDSPAIVFIILSVVMSIATPLLIGTSLDNIVMGFVNPEYGALSKILELIKH